MDGKIGETTSLPAKTNCKRSSGFYNKKIEEIREAKEKKY